MHLKALPIALSNGPQEKQKPRHAAILPKGHSLVIPFQSIGFIDFHILLLQSIFLHKSIRVHRGAPGVCQFLVQPWQKGCKPLGFDSNILNFDQLSFLIPLSQEGVTYLFRKPNAMPIESKPETGWILTLTYPKPYETKWAQKSTTYSYIGLRLC